MRWVLLVLAAGCAHRRGAAEPDPRPALAAWASALLRDDPHAAYQLLAEDVRARVPEPDFLLRWKATANERKDQQEALSARSGQPPPENEAAVRLADGRSAAVRREAGAWRLESPYLYDPSAATPEEALRRFVQALDERSFDAVLRLLAEPLRGTLEQALADRLEKLRQALGKGGLEVSGERARLRYDPRYHIDLKKEHGEWRVFDWN